MLWGGGDGQAGVLHSHFIVLFLTCRVGRLAVEPIVFFIMFSLAVGAHSVTCSNGICI